MRAPPRRRPFRPAPSLNPWRSTSFDLRRPTSFLGGLSSALTLQPIGYLRTRQQVKFQAGHQPSAAAEERNELELLAGCDYESALRDLAGFDRVWLLWWFHRNEGWRPLVLPPRGPVQRRGVFATRSPHRPNPLGLTPVPLIGIKGRTLLLGPCDLVDGTPIFDLKPYVPAFDSFPDSRAGWIDEVDAEMRAPAKFTVHLLPAAEEQARWLRENWGIDFIPRMAELLSRDPSPHRTRRIKRRSATRTEISCGAWRAVFSVEGTAIQVRALTTSYPMSFLTREGYDAVPDRDAQVAFLARWPLKSIPEE
jgi:tRNA-Thr(GGU) m(6)t(6)A37 methyltransferase TsaA